MLRIESIVLGSSWLHGLFHREGQVSDSDPKRASIGNTRRVSHGIIHLKVALIGTNDVPSMQTRVSPGAITWCFRMYPPRFARDAHVGR
jgi:hypothetical protein